eukprot:TRINITY_DN74478_c0_g1_i1.p1 TRINITY_DN74478_c0_g1~~TRINITY_DN74478_c0_g1_i1.p1  ORF type:complete len:929 (+),score=143.22 TRINITY_DN74478_c0_g1_i1:172-2787(+)
MACYGGFGFCGGGTGTSVGSKATPNHTGESRGDRGGGGGEGVGVENDQNKAMLVMRVKMFQKCRPEQKHKWHAYCTTNGKSDFDPNRHSTQFLQQFFNDLESDAIRETKDMRDGGSKVFVAGLPNQTPDEDAIREAFQQFGIVRRVDMKFDSNQDFRGFCFLTYDSADSAKAAVRASGRVLVHGVGVDVKPAVPKEAMVNNPPVRSTNLWAECLGGHGGGAQQSQSVTGVLKLRGVPDECNNTEAISEFFSHFNVVRVLPRTSFDANGWPTGEAFVELASEDAALRALATMQGSMLGQCHIELFGSTAVDLAHALAEKQRNPLLVDFPQTKTLKMRGLPFQASGRDIVHFFAGFQVVAALLAAPSKDGRPSGEAFAEFVSNGDCARAFKAQQFSTMDRRYIELFPSSSQEMARAMSDIGSVHIDSAEVESIVAAASGDVIAGPHARKVYVGNLPPTTTEATLKKHFEIFGEVESLRLLYEQDATLKDYGFVVFKDMTAVEASLKCEDRNKLLFEGNVLTCKRALHRSSGQTQGKGKGEDVCLRPAGKGCDGWGNMCGGCSDMCGWGSMCGGWGPFDGCLDDGWMGGWDGGWKGGKGWDGCMGGWGGKMGCVVNNWGDAWDDPWAWPLMGKGKMVMGKTSMPQAWMQKGMMANNAMMAKCIGKKGMGKMGKCMPGKCPMNGMGCMGCKGGMWGPAGMGFIGGMCDMHGYQNGSACSMGGWGDDGGDGCWGMCDQSNFPMASFFDPGMMHDGCGGCAGAMIGCGKPGIMMKGEGGGGGFDGCTLGFSCRGKAMGSTIGAPQCSNDMDTQHFDGTNMLRVLGASGCGDTMGESRATCVGGGVRTDMSFEGNQQSAGYGSSGHVGCSGAHRSAPY